MSGKQDYSSLAKALDEVRIEYKESRSRTCRHFIDEWTSIMRSQSQKYAKAIRSTFDPDSGVVVYEGKVLLNIKGLSAFTDEQLDSMEFTVTHIGNDVKVNAFQHPNRFTSTISIPDTDKPVKEKPDQNYLKLRKSKY